MASTPDEAVQQPPVPDTPMWPVRMLIALGRGTIDILAYTGGLAILAGDTLRWTGRALVRKRDFRWRDVAFQMVRVGVLTIPLVGAVLFFMGVILAMQMAYVLETLGFTQWVGAVVGVGIFRELGPLISGMTLAGLVGASIAAELGAMVDQEEVLALETMALPPNWYLVMPRVVAAVIMLPIVTLIADFAGIFGGWVISISAIGLSSAEFIDMVISETLFKDVWTGIVKSQVFALLIGLVACYEGMRVKGGAADVGRATTRAVVMAIVAIIFADCVLTALFYWT